MTYKNTSGFTLLEVLIAVVVLSLGMLGVGAALVTVHRTTASSYLAQQSAQLASNIVDRMRQNPTAAQASEYNVVYPGGVVPPPAVSCGPPPAGVACTPAQQAIYDLFQWETALNAALPGAAAVVTVKVTAGSYDAIVVVAYNDAPAAQAMKSATPTRTVQLETLL
jgi:type IV pilus assembly protein PilV